MCCAVAKLLKEDWPIPQEKILDSHVCISVKSHYNIIPTMGIFLSSRVGFVVVNGKCLISILGNKLHVNGK